MPPLTFFWGSKREIIFPGWPGESFGGYISALVLVFVISLLVEWLSHARLVKLSTSSVVTAGLLQTLMYAVRVALAYLLMLAVMSFNIGVLVAAVGGYSAKQNEQPRRKRDRLSTEFQLGRVDSRVSVEHPLPTHSNPTMDRPHVRLQVVVLRLQGPGFSTRRSISRPTSSHSPSRLAGGPPSSRGESTPCCGLLSNGVRGLLWKSKPDTALIAPSVSPLKVIFRIATCFQGKKKKRIAFESVGSVTGMNLFVWCPNLEVLSIKSCPNVTDNSLTRIAFRCSKLRELDISYCYEVSHQSLAIIGRNCPNLKVLKRNLMNWDASQHEGIVPKEYLNACPQDGDSEASAIARFMPNLEHLELRFSKLSARGLCLICEGCLNMECLDLSGCINFTSRDIVNTTSNLKNLKQIIKPNFYIPRSVFHTDRYGHWRLYDERFQTDIFRI
ncbi:hypothetical protein Pint_14377 [Pistacia integerrima]|uniref:Uncharacterized protein n=1 Tax=Pistacia integerrima TaxID=434235 RepID=A0ACC0Y8T3_9ROSI|nr:hypothetical protein Pint_14377 [Pistacia integerrima]